MTPMLRNEAINLLTLKVIKYKGCHAGKLIKELDEEFPNENWLEILMDAIRCNHVLEIQCILPTKSKRSKTFILPMGTKVIWGKSNNDLN